MLRPTVKTGSGQGVKGTPRKGRGCAPGCGQAPPGPSAGVGGIAQGRFWGLLQSLGWDRMECAGSRAPLTFCPLSFKQSYIQSFRERQTGPSLNSLIASSHAVVDLDYDCSSTVPLTTGSGPAVRV